MSRLFGWSYPPGVTGNEPQIAGHPDEDFCTQCDEGSYDEDGICVVCGHNKGEPIKTEEEVE